MAGPPSTKHGVQEPNAIQAELDRILASETFARVDRLSRFLKFVVVAAVAGRGQDLKEYSIALGVFDRPVSYDPQIDSLVRVEASKLRARLKQYYQTEGQDDPIRIEIPKGGYAPVFGERGQTVTKRRVHGWRWLGIILATAAAVIATVWLAGRFRTPLHKPEAPFSLAVLPFTDLSPAQDQEYFCDGMTVELINALSGMEGLRVTSRTSALQFRGKAIDVRSIAKQLNVRAVVEGSVRKEGSKVRITVHLFNAADGYQLWSATFERELDEVFALQQEVSKAIVDQLGSLPPGAKPQRASRPRPKSLEAYHHYLKAQHFRLYGVPDALRKSIEHYKLAVATDPSYALARAGLAEAYARLAHTEAVAPQEVMPEAAMQALKAVELDASVPESHHALGCVKIFSGWDWEGAEREFRTAIALDPAFVEARYAYATLVLNPRARHREAIEQLQAALELDPVSRGLNAELGGTYLKAGEIDRATDQFHRTLELKRDSPGALTHLGIALALKSKYDDAIARFLEARSISSKDSWTISCLGWTYAKTGRRAEAQQLIAELTGFSSGGHVPEFDVAGIYSGLGNNEEAFAHLEKAYARPSVRLLWVKVDWRFANLRSDPRFQALLRRMRLE